MRHPVDAWLFWLVVLLVVFFYYGRALWNSEYRDGLRAAREHRSWSEGYERGSSGGCLVSVLMLVLSALLVAHAVAL